MIKLLLSGKQILIVSLVFMLFVNTTNLTFPNILSEKTIKNWVNTAEATESNDKKVCEDYNGEWKDIGGGDRGCTFENDDDAERYGFRPGFSLDSTSDDAEYGIEDLVTYDNEGNKIYSNTEIYSSEDNPNNIDSDNDGMYDDEELTYEEEERLADAPKVIIGDEVEEDEEESYDKED